MSTFPTDAEREAVKRALEILWGEGNAVGLDGWVGPDRGEEPDPEATIYRRREVRRALAIIEAMVARVRAESLREAADAVEQIDGRRDDAAAEWLRDRADALEAGEGRG